jgi:hypothetical protein
MRRRARWLTPCIASAVLLAGAVRAQAGFVASISGAAELISPPSSSVPGASLSNEYQVWDETSGTLKAPLYVNQAGQPGSYDGLSNFKALGTTLAAGTAYESVFINFDPKTLFPEQSPIASITFTGKIIGIALFGPTLNASDIYGNPTTIYPTGLPNLFLNGRGLQLSHDQRFSISSNGTTLSLQLTAGFGEFEQIRVFIAPASVPEPTSWMIWGVAAAVFTLKRRRLTRRPQGSGTKTASE